MKKYVKIFLVLLLVFTFSITTVDYTDVNAGICDEIPDGQPLPDFCPE